jgi:hypothetical protein
MGYADASVPKSWRRPVATPFNLFTGQLSPLMKAKLELLAQDRVNPDAADLLLFDLIVAVARQRADRQADDRDNVLAALIRGHEQATAAILLEASQRTREEKLYRAGMSFVRALIFVLGEQSEGVPLLRVESEKSLLRRVSEWVRNL